MLDRRQTPAVCARTQHSHAAMVGGPQYCVKLCLLESDRCSNSMTGTNVTTFLDAKPHFAHYTEHNTTSIMLIINLVELQQRFT